MLTSAPLFAQVTGKVIGVIYDAETLASADSVFNYGAPRRWRFGAEVRF